MKNKTEIMAASMFRSILTLISPRLNTVVCYRVKTGCWPDLKNPSTFKEKLIKLKLDNYNHNALVKKCADKYAVRAFVEDRLAGCPEISGGVY